MTSEISNETDAPSPQTGDQPVQAGEPAPIRQKRSLLSDPIPWLLLVTSLGLDQLTKALVVGNLEHRESWPEQGFFRITHAWNTGTAFSLFQDQSDILTFVSFAAVVGLYFVYRSVEAPNVWVRMAFGLLLGGAFGNLIDRLRLGHVTDFVDIGPWPIFNVADSSIMVGIFVLFLFFWTNSSDDQKKKKNLEPPGETPESASQTTTSTGGGQRETG